MAELLKLAKRAVEVALADGAEFADADLSENGSRSAAFEKSSLHATNDRVSGGISVRAIVKGAMGFSSDARLTPEAAEQCARRAVGAAKLAEPDPDFVRLPSPASYDEVDGLHDPEVEKLGLPWLIDMLAAEVAAARAVDPRVVVGAHAGAGWGRSAFVNSCGVEREDTSTNMGCSITPILKKGDDVGTYFDFKFARRFADFSPPGSPGVLGRRTAETARSFLGAKFAPTKVLPVVLGPLASRSLFFGVAAAAGGEGIQRGRSFLAGRLGESVGSELLTLVDDGLIPGGMGSGALDGEGSVRKKVTIVEKGVFRQELHGLYTSEKARKRGQTRENTGHGGRSGGGGPTNVIPTLGSKTSEDIIAETDEGVYVNFGGIFPDMVTGEISASVDLGFKIEGGKLAYPLKNTMLGVNVFELLDSLDAVSSDCRREPGMVLPTLRFGGVRVASAPAG
jgi:PmbA protein